MRNASSSPLVNKFSHYRVRNKFIKTFELFNNLSDVTKESRSLFEELETTQTIFDLRKAVFKYFCKIPKIIFSLFILLWEDKIALQLFKTVGTKGCF